MNDMTSTTSPTVTSELARELAAAYRPDGTIDLDRLVPLLHPDVVLHVPGDQPLGGDHRGLVEIAGFLVGSREVTVAGEHIDRVDTLVGDDHVALLVRVTGDRFDGRRLDNVTMHLARIDGAGLVTDIWFHNRDQAHVDAFWS
jgi:ketosteroid isomerase-like protein